MNTGQGFGTKVKDLRHYLQTKGKVLPVDKSHSFVQSVMFHTKKALLIARAGGEQELKKEK